MVKKQVTTPAPSLAEELSIFCVGECGKKLVLTPSPGLLLQKVEVVCVQCSKRTKYNMPNASATKVIGLPPGQETIEASTKDDE